ncbi:2-oxoglutarate dehydrogenase E1 component [Tribonema minus]|uniref:2-oxoglutarate dehydrogenase, mitochondrial n=1 Tax=Tribonema minus TaxID=303371 RepID=A0A835Z9M1_9STRA|nr:2-oxoglutarate dehydrogenase E1 component [Tribonema minus]
MRVVSPTHIRCHHSSGLSSQGPNSIYVESMYSAWKSDPSSVHKSWDAYFKSIDKGQVASQGAFVAPPRVLEVPTAHTAAAPSGTPQTVSDSLGLSYLIRAYQVRGHEAAKLDPLGLHGWRPQAPPPELDPKFHGFEQGDMDRVLNLMGRSSGGMVGYLEELTQAPRVTLRQVVARLEQTYCNTLGVEYMHMRSREKCNWIRRKVENPAWLKYTKERKLHIFERLCFADTFEKFLQNKYNTVKRFGLNGGESVIPALKAMVDKGSELGIQSFVFGMPHRGRLNVLANVLRKPMPQIFKEFQGTHYNLESNKSDDWSSSGDVKYHLGTSMDRSYPDGRRVHLSLVANPSHLEAVDPVVVGKTRAAQFYNGDTVESKLKAMAVLLHGDAAFAGQGVVYETMQLMRVADYSTGGTIHVIVNNQVGFTTDPENDRSTDYCSDLGKTFEIPIFHCNGDDPLSVCTALELAVEWRQTFGEDCIVDMICYRRMGHNEIDQPLFTQPTVYKKIANHPDTVSIFEARLLSEGVASKEELDGIKAFVQESYERDFDASKTWETSKDDWLSSKWSGFKSPRQLSRIRQTGVDLKVLRVVGEKMTTIPSSITLHPQLVKIVKARADAVSEGHGIDWATAESLAFGTLLLEGNHVRLTGQDVERGTFSQRHSVLHCQQTNHQYTPLNHLAKTANPSMPTATLTYAPEAQAKYTVRNSILSEFAVLGFEMGYSLENPNALVLWEAQFGDFSNGAQVMIDQFICAGEDKWLRQSGLTLLLPHGYDGQGAEHSSCRMERFLQMCDDDPDTVPQLAFEQRMQIQHANWQVVNCTTPANYYHVLRRQVHREFRKPLIVVAPKRLLRLKAAASTLDEMGAGTMFQRLMPEENAEIISEPANVKKLIFCSGQIYYDLIAEREKIGRNDIAIARVEQIAPFPFDRVAEEAAKYPEADVLWVQEEPKNMGAYSYVMPRMMTATRDINNHEKRPIYVGRDTSAAPATGMAKVHVAELEAILQAAIHS